MSLASKIHIARRFQRSIRIDADLGNPDALEGFVCPQSSADLLLTMARHAKESGQGAFTWTGPYGGGKSSLAVALSALLNGNAKLRNQAEKVFGRKLASAIWRAFPPCTKGWRIVPVVGRRDDPVAAIGDAVAAAGLVPRKPRGGWTEAQLVKALTDAAAQSRKSYGGVVLLIDEMGKFLEASAQQGADLYVFQQLAEAASRSNGRLLIVGILHQAFEEYAQRLTHEKRDEWAKIQGRFVDLIVNAAGDEQLDLISRAIESGYRPDAPKPLARTVATLARPERAEDAKRLALTLERCWPLHPAVACLLGPISRRRFGQNQRSIFGFLNSSEPHGFQDFLHRAGKEDLYSVDGLWDYLRANLEPSILASPDGHRWALAAEALERCEAASADAEHIRLLKTVAVIDLFKERSGLVANLELLRACLPSYSESALRKALTRLQDRKLVVFRKFQDAYAIFAGSDFDVEQALRQALEDVTDIDFAALNALAGLQPILAKRHYHETGALRWFDVSLAPLSGLGQFTSDRQPSNGLIGEFVLAIPTEGERGARLDEICREAARRSDKWDLVIGVSKHAQGIVSLAKELIALESVRNDRPELAGDPVARREVFARVAATQTQFEIELRKAFDTALWYRKRQREPKPYRLADLNSLASDLADRRFNESPRLHNELLNRQMPSGSAVAGQNDLLRSMVRNEGEERLGIEGFPAAGGLFASLLEATGLYAQGRDGWRFTSPAKKKDEKYRLAPMWDAAAAFLKKNRNRTITVSEVYDVWRAEPFGVKDGLMPVLSVAFILSQRNNIAVYREGIFRARFDDVDVEIMAKDPAMIQLRWMDLSEVARRLLSEMAEVVRGLDRNNSLTHLEPIDVARGLVGIYENLPPWTKRTMRLSANAVRIRDIFKRARDPNQFLFDDLPGLLGNADALAKGENLERLITGVREGLEELTLAYPSMLRRLNDIMLAELQVPNTSPQAIAELRDRAENIRQLAGDFHLEAFVGRLSQFDGTETAIEGIASLAASKPPRDWVDPDLDRAMIDLADMAQKFLRAETYARVKGRPQKRQAMAVVIGMNGRPGPLLEEFHVADADRAVINDLIERVTAALDEGDTSRRNVILAALAELSARYMQSAADAAPNGSRKAVHHD